MIRLFKTVVAVCLGVGFGVALLAVLFFVPYVHARIIRKDPTIKGWMFILGPALFFRPAVEGVDKAVVPNYAVIQDDEKSDVASTGTQSANEEKGDHVAIGESPEKSYQELVAEADEKVKAKLCARRGPIGSYEASFQQNSFDLRLVFV